MKRIILTILLPVLMLLPAATVMEPVYACGTSPAAQQVAGGIDQTGPTAADCGQSAIDNAITQVVRILTIGVGAAAIIAIIWSGFKYITSGGDSGKVGNAKNTLIYALIGIAIAVLAQLLVNIVITQSNNVASCPANQHLDAKNNCVQN